MKKVLIVFAAVMLFSMAACEDPAETITTPDLCKVCGEYPSVCVIPTPCNDCNNFECTCEVGCGDCGICEECDPPTPPCDCGTCDECNPTPPPPPIQREFTITSTFWRLERSIFISWEGSVTIVDMTGRNVSLGEQAVQGGFTVIDRLEHIWDTLGDLSRRTTPAYNQLRDTAQVVLPRGFVIQVESGGTAYQGFIPVDRNTVRAHINYLGRTLGGGQNFSPTIERLRLAIVNLSRAP